MAADSRGRRNGRDMPTAQQGQNQANPRALLEMAQDRSLSGRNALAQSVVDLCLDDESDLKPREAALTFEILHKLIHGVEMKVRRDLAQRLAPRRDVPRELVVTLANDQIDVAYPVLVESEVLEDADLIAVIRERQASHQIAITLRERVSSDVSAALVDTRNVDVIDSLVRNPAAEIAPVTMERLVEMSRDAPPLRRPLLQRRDMPPDLARRMSDWVGDALKAFIAAHYPAAFDRIERDIDEVVRDAVSPAERVGAGDLQDRIAAIETKDGITAATLIQALSGDDIELFEALFARLTGIDSVAMPVVVYDPGGEPFAVACKACGFSAQDFERIYALLIDSLAGEREADPGEFKRIRAFYGTLDDGAARSLVSEWRRVPAKLWESA